MAQMDISSKMEPVPLSSKAEKKPLFRRSSLKIPRRTLTLINITFLLNVLFWSSLVCVGITIYQIVSDPHDVTTMPSQVLTTTSAVVTILYTVFHTLLSLKRQIWMAQKRDISVMQKTYHIAVRIAAFLCILWLLTSGWNMIMVARRPVCLDEGPGLQTWEFGLRCKVTRVSTALAVVALFASVTMFVMLATVRRPFEAHLFKCMREQPVGFGPSPATSRNASPQRGASPDKRRRMRGGSTSTYQSNPSNFSEADIETLDLNGSRPNSLYAAPRQQATGFNMMTSSSGTPMFPLPHTTPPRTSSLASPPPLFPPPLLPVNLTRPPRLTGSTPFHGPLSRSLAPQYAASSQRAIHPVQPCIKKGTSGSNPHLPRSFSHHNLHSRSTISLTVPPRLSTATSTTSIADSVKSAPEDNPFVTRIDTPTSDKKHLHNVDIEYLPPLILPDVTLGVKGPESIKDSNQLPENKPDVDATPATTSPPSAHPPKASNRHEKSSMDLAKTRTKQELPFKRSPSLESPDTTAGAMSIEEVMKSNMQTDIKTMPKTRRLHSQRGGRNRTDHEYVRNKPLPRIARLS